MNIEITKSKNNYSPEAVKNRLIRLEKMLQQLMQSLESETKNNTNLNSSGDLLNNLSLSSSILRKTEAVNRTVTNPKQIPAIQQKDNKNSLLLSRGQMMAELAIAIMRANQRNY